MNRNMIQWRQQVMNSPKVLALPVMTHPGVEKIGATVKQAVTDGECHFRAIQALTDLPMAAATMIMDLSVEAEAFGATPHFTDHEVPSILEAVAPNAEAIERLAIPSLNAGRVPQYLKATRLAAQNITDRPVIAGCIGPISLAGRLHGMTEIMMAVLLEPDMIHKLLDKCTQFLIQYVTAFRDAGADGIFMAEPAAGMLAPAQCDEFSSAYVKRVVDAVQTDDFAVILHNCGNPGAHNKSMQSTGAWGFHLGNKNDIGKALQDFSPENLVFGNIDPAGVIRMGSVQDVRDNVLRVLTAAAGHKNFVLSTGCDTPPAVPWANIQAFFSALEEFNQRRH
ncbi:MAG TPA: uroporphyrinogen decarboxylase family protein [Planctomycetota bacterium]|jgi:uroporphyrinogen decarboxylase